MKTNRLHYIVPGLAQEIRSEEQGGDVYIVDDTYYYSTLIQASLKHAHRRLEGPTTRFEELDEIRYQQVIKQASETINEREENITTVAEYWRL